MNNNRTHLSKYLPWVDSIRSVEDVKTYIEKCELLYRQKEEVSFVIMYEDKLVGRIGLHHLNLQSKIAA